LIIKPGDIKNKSSSLCIAIKRYIYFKILELEYEIHTHIQTHTYNTVVLESEIRERVGTTNTDISVDSK